MKRPRWIACLAILSMPIALPAQARDVRGALDSAFVILGAIDSTESVAAAQARCAAMTGRAGSLCGAFVLLRMAELDPTPANALRADQAFRAVHFSEDKWPYVWYGMGLTRIVLDRAGNVAREGPLQPPGVTNQAAATGRTRSRSIPVAGHRDGGWSIGDIHGVAGREP